MDDITRQYLTVKIGDQWCGIDVNRIIEVFHLMAFKEVPTERKDVLGVITVRNQVMPLIDMRQRFGIQNASFKLDTPIIALQESHGPIALVCDDTNRVENIDEAQISALGGSSQFPDIIAIAKLAAQLILLLDTEKLSREIHAATQELSK
jgi:purine-binding chemotaxis protein CheW